MDDRPEGVVREREAALRAVDETRKVGDHRIFVLSLLREVNEMFGLGEVCCAISVGGFFEQCRDVTGIAFKNLPVNLSGGFGVSSLLEEYALEIELFQGRFECDGDWSFERLSDGR